MRFEDHCEESQKLFGNRFEEVHLWLDELHRAAEEGRYRRIRHNEAGIKQVVELFGEKAGEVARQHIISDLKEYGWTEAEGLPKDDEEYWTKVGWEILWDAPDDRPLANELLSSLKRDLPALEELLERCNDHWTYEDGVYRFYHQSFKVFSRLQATTSKVVEALQALLPETPMNEWFLEIVRQGTGKEFKREDNDNWLPVTRPILEAFFHARFFLEMAVKYARELEFPPQMMPSGWAAFLYLFNLR
ncbi:MAG: DUF6915 family protein [Syntrophobacteraceae bacterium]